MAEVERQQLFKLSLQGKFMFKLSFCAVWGVEINDGGRRIQRLFWQLFSYFPIFLESLVCGQEREEDLNGSQKMTKIENLAFSRIS